jgi:hypothetical protein
MDKIPRPAGVDAHGSLYLAPTRSAAQLSGDASVAVDVLRTTPVSALGLGFGDTLSLSPAPVVVVLPGYRRTATLESVATDSPPLASSVKHRINSGKSL